MPYGSTTLTQSTGSSVSFGGTGNAGSSGTTGQVGSGPSLTVNTAIGLGDSLNTGMPNDSGLDATGNVQDLYDQQQEEQTTETNSYEFGSDDIYETEMISSEVVFVTKFSESQMSLIISQDASSNGILSMFEDDLAIVNSTQQNQSLNEQTIKPSVNSRNY